MADIADITLKLDTAPLKDAVAQLDNLRARGKGAADGMKNLENQAKGTSNVLRNLFQIAAITTFIARVRQAGDEFTNFQNRLKLVTNSTQQLTAVTEELFAVSQRTRSSFAATGEIYSRIALQAKSLGLSQGEILKITENLNKAVILSGANAQEASAGLIQLAQGLGSGALRGDELRSVLEQLPLVAQIIADKLGVTVGQLRVLGAEGKITGKQVADALLEADDKLTSFSKNTVTIAQAWTMLNNAFVKMVGDFNNATGAFAAVAGLIKFIADNLVELTKVMIVFGVTAGSIFLAGKIEAGIMGIRTAILLLNAAMSANPFVFFARIALIAIAAVSSALAVWGEDLGKIFVAVEATAQVIWNNIKDGFADMANAIIIVAENLANGFLDTFRPVVELVGKQLPSVNLGRVSYTTDSRNAIDEFRKNYDMATGKNIKLPQVDLNGGKTNPATSPDAEALKKAQERQLKLLKEIKGAAYDYGQTIKDLNVLLKQGKITTDEYNEAVKKLNIAVLDHSKTLEAGFERGFLKLTQDVEDFASIAEKMVTDAYSGMEDAAVKFFRTGKLDFKDMVNSMIDDLIRLQFRQNAAGLLGQISGGLGGFLGNIFGGSLNTVAQGAASSFNGQTINWNPPVAGFATGGSFDVGGVGGTDSQLVAFKASPNERVTVETPAQQRAGENSGGVTIQYNIDAQGAGKGVADELRQMIMSVSNSIEPRARAAVSEANKRNPSYLR